MSDQAAATGTDTGTGAPTQASTGPSAPRKALAGLYRLSRQHSLELFILVAVMLLVSGYLALIYAPEVDGENFAAPKSQRIFYFHVPAAWVGLLAFGLVFGFSMTYMKTRDRVWDQLAYASAEVGALFCTLAIATGPIWAKAEWGIYWNDDPKLTVTLILWLTYIGYLIFRNSSDEDDAELAAILSVFGFITIPMTFIASRWIESQHPNVVASEGGGLEGPMVLALVFTVFTFTLLFYYLLIKRFSLLRLTERLEQLKLSVGGMLDG